MILRYFLPFGIERLSVADDEAIKDITVRRPYDFCKARRTTEWMKGILGENGLLLVEGAAHAKLRKALAPAFSTSAIKALEMRFWEKGLLLGNVIERERRVVEGHVPSVEILDCLNWATLDIIGLAGFGLEVKSLEAPSAPLRKAYSALFAFDFVSFVVQALRMFWGVMKYFPCEINRAMDRSEKFITQVADDVVQSKLDKDGLCTGGKDIISLIVKHNEAKASSPEDVLSFIDIRDQVKAFLGAGHDTTATAVAWTIDLLSKNQCVQDRLRAEIQAASPELSTPGVAPDPEALAATQKLDTLTYLDNVCQESLRFIPPIPTVIRAAAVDTRIGEHAIPAGTNIYITSNAVNRLTHYWGNDADGFNTDRWDQLPAAWVPNAYQTFLEGPRGCIGRKFAETEMKVFLCCLLARFRFIRDCTWPDQEQRKVWRIVMRPKDGIRVLVAAV
ncbi:Cytochrome P450 monooxygenase FUM15 [Fulvia fulva]|uniref:Cytochrome P450 monooxygenase FUM15 n=1 Tax=Passalora fulva TaxID=5499 RepID=A0A9Q8LCQ9_PASFU|nr:Cytochrome P450 monooxygenase FUM15 [Fulvia fulva]KAK4628996.1 Cytochrome P450 monooxygenase FUM15 [Fulvia fulva]KAK4630203.1 Cytochrome P450 monooxygenase FUM15 [Fulvia fulva]UJO14980.1 Cytochrome P450 monooxygenase FUM15 [Fulvia fulva]WPV12754.1 Cytochrome P450 monooxygenase FUM15 [Fulvia fulva]WPV27339.1 Cytochrome P450 monooxygenase FUM15 [Fulvia fulva]